MPPKFGSSGKPYGSVGSTDGMGKCLPEYFVWHRMILRCHNASSAAYKNYGGRGITVCDEWRKSFAAFLKAVGPRPTPKHSLERMDNNGGYAPGNVRWAKVVDQANNRRTNVFVDVGGESLTLTQAARRLGISYRTAVRRYHEDGEVERDFPRRVILPGSRNSVSSHA